MAETFVLHMSNGAVLSFVGKADTVVGSEGSSRAFLIGNTIKSIEFVDGDAVIRFTRSAGDMLTVEGFLDVLRTCP